MVAALYPDTRGSRALPEDGSKKDLRGASQQKSIIGLASPGPERDALYKEFRPLIQRLIRKYGDDPEQRRDLEGEIYCLFCELLAQYEPERGVPLKPYLVNQLSVSVYTLARRRWRQAQREFCLELTQTSAYACDPSQDWDNSLLVKEICRILPDAVARLPQRQRQVVVWRYYDSLSFEEIANAMNVQVATTRSLLRHGLNKLRDYFADEGISFSGAV